MQISVARLWKSDIANTGTFSVDGQQKYFSLELPDSVDGQYNVTDKTCIPPGTYEVQRIFSPHFNQMMPHIVNVPGRTAIEIHYGNFPQDVLGCLLIGRKRITQAQIGDSRSAFEEFNEEFEDAIAAGETVTLTVG